MPGAFDVQIHYNGTLFAQGTEIEAMQRGNLEAAMISPQDVAALIPEYSIFTTGYLIRDPGHLDAVYDGDIGAEYKERVGKDIGVQIVRSQYLGTRHVILREPKDVKAPADLAGLKLRMPGSEAWQFLGNALGANATPLAFEEVYLAHADRHHRRAGEPAAGRHGLEVLRGSKQVVLTGHMVSNTFFTLAKPFWDGLSDDEKKAIEAAEAAAKTLNDEGVTATEAEGDGLLREQGREGHRRRTSRRSARQVQKAFLESDFAKSWPAGHARSDQPGGRVSLAPAGEGRAALLVKRLERGAELAAAAMFAVLFGAFMIQIVSRYVLNMPVSWSLELCSIAYVWVVFWTCDILVRERQHIVFDVLYQKFPPRSRRWVAVANTAALGLVFLAALPGTLDYIHFLGAAARRWCCTCAWTSSIRASASS